MATTEPVTVTLFDLTDGSSRAGRLVGSTLGQMAVFANWPRPFVWNRPAAGTIDAVDVAEPRWLRPSLIEVTRTHERPEAGVALVTFDGDFDVEPTPVTPPLGVLPTQQLLAEKGGDWVEVLATVDPVLADLPTGATEPPRSLPNPAEFPPATIKELLGPEVDPGWRICKLLRLCP